MANSATNSFPLRHTPQSVKSSSKTNKDARKGIWSSLLDSVSSAKRLDEKTLVMLGGNVESQNDFLEAISKDATASETPISSLRYRRNQRDRPQRKRAPVANQYALGYTYQDVTGADEDDILCRLHVYMLADTRPVFAPLLAPLFNIQTIPKMLVVILLDWQEPWNWLRQLRERIRVLRSVLNAKDTECKNAMDDTMEDWRERRRGPATEDTAVKPIEFAQTHPLDPGEWDEPLGVPLCVVCHNVERIDILERECGWKDREFDTVMQYLRTVLLKHGASLIYTSASDSGSLQTLLRSSLGIQMLQRKTILKRNVTDRDKVLIPPNWDSWGNIRAQNDSFDVEKVSKAWTRDIQLQATPQVSSNNADNKRREILITSDIPDKDIASDGSVEMYEKVVRHPKHFGSSSATESLSNTLKAPVLECPDYQEFLAGLTTRLQECKARDEAVAQRGAPRKPRTRWLPEIAQIGYVNEHLGPIQFNVGGIQVDAEAAVEALQHRTAQRMAEAKQAQDDSAPPDERSEEEKMRAFFTGLKVEAKGSGAASA